MRFYNQNHFVGRTQKTPTGFDKLAMSNRQSSMTKLSSVRDDDDEKIRRYIKRTATDINNALIEKQAIGGDFDLITQATGLVSSKLGIDPQNAQSIVSNLIQKVMKIQELYGGDEQAILRRLVDEMQNGMTEQSPSNNQVGEAQINMGSAFSYQKVEEQVKFELMKQLGMTSTDSERITKSILTESRDLSIALRPADLRKISLAMIQLIQQFDDVTIIYGIRNNPELIKQLKLILSGGMMQ
jgi:hypothetical protein